MNAMTPERLRSELDRIFDRETERRNELGSPTVFVHAPTAGIDYRYGDTEIAFHGASVGKLAAATLTAQLIDEDALRPNTRIATMLDPEVLTDLFVLRGTDHRDEITVEHLLTHTSGLDDYFEGKTRDRTTLIQHVLAHPDETWSARSLLDWARENQRMRAVPGKKYRYSDTGFSLLELVLETVTGTDYGRLVHERIIEPLQLNRSRIHLRTRSDSGEGLLAGDYAPGNSIEPRIAPLWVNGVEASTFRSLSLDQGAGGGLTGPPEEFACFVRALFAGDLVSPASRTWLSEQRNRFHQGIRYGAGTMEIRFGEFMPLLGRLPRPLGHIGVLSTHAYHVRELDADIVMNFHSTGEMSRSFRRLIDVVTRLSKLG